MAQITSHRGKMEAPSPTAGPFTAAIIGFLNWINVFTNALRTDNQLFNTISAIFSFSVGVAALNKG